MDVARTLRDARLAAGMTQRQLAARAGAPHAPVPRTGRGQTVPRVDTFDRLLRATDMRVSAQRVPGYGVDRTQIRELLRLTPEGRLQVAVASANNPARLLASIKPQGR